MLDAGGGSLAPPTEAVALLPVLGPTASMAIQGLSPPMLPHGPSMTVDCWRKRREASLNCSLTRTTCETPGNSLTTVTSFPDKSPTTPRMVVVLPLERCTSKPALTRNEITLSTAWSLASGSITTIMGEGTYQIGASGGGLRVIFPVLTGRSGRSVE